jgi:hypothetical protein
MELKNPKKPISIWVWKGEELVWASDFMGAAKRSERIDR